jgi:hypothetical protein
MNPSRVSSLISIRTSPTQRADFLVPREAIIPNALDSLLGLDKPRIRVVGEV